MMFFLILRIYQECEHTHTHTQNAFGHIWAAHSTHVVFWPYTIWYKQDAAHFLYIDENKDDMGFVL